jgi:polyphosphate kinase 2 (PPK2 family)
VKAENFIVSKRPHLGSIKNFPRVDFADYERCLATMQSSLQAIQQAYLGTRERAVVVLEGWDTAGRVASCVASGGHWTPAVSKFTPLRRRHRTNEASIISSGSGRGFPSMGRSSSSTVRGTGFATKQEWRRAYEEINQFERLLVEDGIRIVKIFLHITPGEQIRRFKNRVTDPLKRWKLSYEDFRNRERWADYELAMEDMMDETSTKLAPWYLVPANDKPFSRIAAFTILIARLGKGVSLAPPRSENSRISGAPV